MQRAVYRGGVRRELIGLTGSVRRAPGFEDPRSAFYRLFCFLPDDAALGEIFVHASDLGPIDEAADRGEPRVRAPSKAAARLAAKVKTKRQPKAAPKQKAKPKAKARSKAPTKASCKAGAGLRRAGSGEPEAFREIAASIFFAARSAPAETQEPREKRRAPAEPERAAASASWWRGVGRDGKTKPWDWRQRLPQRRSTRRLEDETPSSASAGDVKKRRPWRKSGDGARGFTKSWKAAKRRG